MSSKYITVKLTEDQALALRELCVGQFGKGNEKVAFLLRIATKIDKQLA